MTLGRMEEAYFDLALVGNGGDSGFGWHGDLPNTKVVLDHGVGIDIPVICESQ